ncbi:MAG: hypothetical protein M1812_000459 [Candelaria pacifica]|nr:MAG: hypothetical protein M1812_000459 [Candelaria pacifica]
MVGSMDAEVGPHSDDPPDFVERKTLCFPSPIPGIASHHGDEGFREGVQRYFRTSDNNAAEQFVSLKASLRDAGTEEFWTMLMEGLTTITNSMYAFVGKRILVDDQNTAIEMPPLGEPGSCLMGVAFYYNDGRGLRAMNRDYKYIAYGAPCAHMRHDKVFIIPERLEDFIPNNPNNPPKACEAYIGVPLFHEGKCYAHFGMMWTKEGLETCGLSWGFVEMFMHSLEDLISQRILDGRGYTNPDPAQKPAKVIPAEAITASQSLRPYARSLSHELRTPMQGVVGMLDVMHATVQEAVEGETNNHIRKIFRNLRENIEVVQGNSRRAVEAADNVVHAYDLNMEVPDTPNPPIDDDSTATEPTASMIEKRPNILIEGNNIPIKPTVGKRRRASPTDWDFGSAIKHRHIDSTVSSPGREVSPLSKCPERAVEDDTELTSAPRGIGRSEQVGVTSQPALPSTGGFLGTVLDPERIPAPGLRHTQLRQLLHNLVNESLRVGGRPDSAVAIDTELGEIIEVRSRSSKGDANTKVIEWSVDASVPESMLVDERDLTKLVSCVFLNAVKFTEHGRIELVATLSPKSRYIVINVKDTGPGIPQAFVPYLFKPFSREDDSLTRQKEGLGLGLLVAKGLVRKIGGDLVCVRSDTTGPHRGSEFELRVPVTPTDASRPGTPNRTPTRSATPSRFSLDSGIPPAPHTPRGRQSFSRGRPGASHSPDPYAKPGSPLLPSSPSRRNSISNRRTSTKKLTFDRKLANKHPLTFLVAEDNKINRRLLVNMLSKLGYTSVHEAYDGAEAVRQMAIDRDPPVDVVLMDLWMPSMDGYEATEKILQMKKYAERKVTVLAVSADVTGEALERAAQVGMEGFMTKPYKLLDLERLIIEYCSKNVVVAATTVTNEAA